MKSDASLIWMANETSDKATAGGTATTGGSGGTSDSKGPGGDSNKGGGSGGTSDGAGPGGEANTKGGGPGATFFEKVRKLYGCANTKKVKVKQGEEMVEKEEPFGEDDALEAMQAQCNELADLRKKMSAANEALDSINPDVRQVNEALIMAANENVLLKEQLDTLTQTSAANEALITEQEKTLDSYVNSLAVATEKVQKLTGDLAAANENVTKEHAAFVNERGCRAKVAVDAAVRSGVITKAQAEQYEAAFVNEDWNVVEQRLATEGKKLKTDADGKTSGGSLGQRNSTGAGSQNPGGKLNEMANEIFEERMRKGEKPDYAECYERAKKTPEGSQLFAAMVNEANIRKTNDTSTNQPS